MRRLPKVLYWFERRWWDVYEWAWRVYFNVWACRRGIHRMKMSGCMYCGAGGSQQREYFVTWS